MDTEGHLYIIGCGANADSFPAEGREVIGQASLIAGGKNLLARFAPEDKEQLLIAADARKQAEELAVRSKKEIIAVLASGDALFNGIGARFADIMQAEDFTIIPNITFFQYLCARLAIPWSNTQLFSIHGGKPLPWRNILSCESAIVYCDHKLNFAGAAAELIRKWPSASPRNAAAGISLGLKDEKIIKGTLAELSENTSTGSSVLAILKEKNEASAPPLPLGLEDDKYEHENNMITHPETRAVILSKLGLRKGIMWDIGAGSGSVGIEAAGLCSDLKVYAVEKSPQRAAHLRENIIAEGLANISAVEGDALEKTNSLPDPDIVFAGGGGSDIAQIVKEAFSRLRKDGRLVVSSVTLETNAILSTMLTEHRKEVLSVSISRSRNLQCSTMMKAENPITIFVYGK